MFCLKKDGNLYVDQDGVSHESPEMWLWCMLGGCNCGTSDKLAVEALRLLEEFSLPHEERQLKIYEDRFLELMAHWFDDKDFTEHGGGIAGSWLSPKGSEVLVAIKTAKKGDK